MTVATTLDWLGRRLERLPPRHHLLLAWTTLAAGFGADLLLGREMGVSVLYLVPVAQCAWYVGRRAGLAISAAAALSWLVANQLVGPSAALLPAAWNMLTRASAYVAVALTLSLLRRTLAALQAAIAREQALSRNDALTGIPNARAFIGAVEAERRRALRYAHPYVVAYLDADGFKSVNDSEGHDAGNRALQLIGRTLVRALRSTDTVARLGGDEFAVLLPETGEEGARQLLEKLRLELAGPLHAEGWSITFSIGAVLVDPRRRDVRAMSAEELLRLADALMYRVKRSGKNAVSLHTASAEAAAEVRSAIGRGAGGG